jgi:uncharacterized BrkB/YihY/UPF0761 family membrane protein
MGENEKLLLQAAASLVVLFGSVIVAGKWIDSKSEDDWEKNKLKYLGQGTMVIATCLAVGTKYFGLMIPRKGRGAAGGNDAFYASLWLMAIGLIFLVCHYVKKINEARLARALKTTGRENRAFKQCR